VETNVSAVKNRSVAPLESHLGYWLRFVSNHVSHAFSQKLEGRGVSVAEWVIMRELFDLDTAAPSDLADRIGMTRGAITKRVDSLVAKALVTRTPGKDDRRYQAIAITAAGRALVPKLAALADRNDAEFFGHLKASERSAIESAMKNIVSRHGLQTVPIE
jgi:DNA-binding MarR family transcriptional regulator